MTTSARVCSQCGAAAPDDARFCSQCATPLGGDAAPSPVAQERRQVTVSFSDLSGFTALSERLDPEDVRDIVNKVWDRAGEIVERYEGRINKLLGDAVMAIFGDPVAHEDDPLRAVRAALELHEAVEALNADVEPRVGAPIGMHTGVNTGVVLTSETVLDGKQQTGPLGDTINVAARLQSLAQTGQVLVGPETRRSIERAFELEDLGLHDLKGKGEPVAVARVVSIARSVTPARRQGRFVGRDSELNILRDEYERAKGGTPSFVAVSAEAGAGKSRLVEEFRRRIAANAIWLEGRAYPFAQNIPYYAITDLISNRLGIDETDSADTVREKLEQRVVTAAGEAANIISTDMRGDLYIDALRARMVTRRLGARVLSGLVGNVDIPKLDASATAAWVADNAALVANDPDFNKVQLTPKHAGMITEFSRSTLLQSSPDIEMLLRARRDELAAFEQDLEGAFLALG